VAVWVAGTSVGGRGVAVAAAVAVAGGGVTLGRLVAEGVILLVAGGEVRATAIV